MEVENVYLTYFVVPMFDLFFLNLARVTRRVSSITVSFKGALEWSGGTLADWSVSVALASCLDCDADVALVSQTGGLMGRIDFVISFGFGLGELGDEYAGCGSLGAGDVMSATSSE